MERVPNSHLGRPESRICFKVEAVTRTEHASQGKNRNSSVTGHTNGVAPSSGEKSIHRLLFNSSTYLPARLVAGSSLRNCYPPFHGKSTWLPFSSPESRVCFKVET